MEELTGKKILFVITKSNWGGAQRYVYDLATGFDARGACVKVAYGGTGEVNAPQGTLAARLADAGIEGIFVKSFMRDISFVREFKVLRELMEIFRRERPDVVHLNSSKAGGIGALAARFAGVPNVIFTSHGLPYDEDRPMAVRTFRWLATWLTFLLAHRVILISNDTYRRARRFPFCAHKIRLVYNGIRAEPLETREAARAMLVPEGAREVPWIGTISELTRNKGLSYLIEAARILRERGHVFQLAIIGAGEDYASLEHRLAEYELTECAHLLGFVPNAARLLSAFDIFTLTSVKEGHPYVLLEAAQARCAVLGSRIPGIMDVIDNTTGLLVDARDPEAIASALETLLTDSRRRQELGANLAARVAENFSIEQMIAETAAAYT